ncbi:MAG: OsmC family protein [Gemmatimonadota bacterium]
MDAVELRARQGPLKDGYRDDPGSARTRAAASGRVRVGEQACEVRSWEGTTMAGLHPATGGDGTRACSADMLLEALVACAGVTLASVATHLGIELRRAEVHAEGVWDARGTLGVDRSAPVGLTEIELSFDLETDAAPAMVDRLVQLTERYCVIYRTLVEPPAVSVRLKPPSDEDR